MKITEPSEWTELKKNFSGQNELIIFKYSPICPISKRVENHFDKWYAENKDKSGLELLKINVIKERPLSNYIAEELKIKHESPQAIWLDKNLNIKWYASHMSIDEKTLSSNL